MTIRAEDLTSEQIDGLIMNIPSHEALDGLNMSMVIGATFAGKDEGGSYYLESLADIAYSDKPDIAEKFKAMVKITDSKRGIQHQPKGDAKPITFEEVEKWKKPSSTR